MKNGKALIGKIVILKDWNGNRSNDWGIVKDYDGERYLIAFLGDKLCGLPYYRNEFIVPRDGIKREFRKCSNQK